MTTPHPYRLRAYHNPQSADASVVPAGWRMLYADEFPLRRAHGRKCRLYVSSKYNLELVPHFGDRENCTGALSFLTYIVPVAP